MANLIQNLETFTEKPLVRSLPRGTHVKAFGKVGVLYGGRSSERAVSLQSGEQSLEDVFRSLTN